MDSNHRPLPCQGSALTRLSYGPTSGFSLSNFPIAHFSMPSTMRRVWRGCCVDVYVQSLRRGHTRRITFSVRVVIRWTSRGNIFSFGRLSKLPDIGEVDAAFRWVRRNAGKCTSRRRRTRVARDPVCDLSSGGILPNVLGGDDRCAAGFFRGDSRTINPNPKSRRLHAVHPGK